MMLKKFIFPLVGMGVLGLLLMIGFLVRESMKEDAVEPIVVGKEDLTVSEAVRKKLNETILPELRCNHVTVEEMVEFLRLRSIELDEG